MHKFLIGLLLLLAACTTDRVDENELLRQREDQAIQDYLQANDLTAQKQPEGFYYRVLQEGTGTTRPKAGDKVIVHYEGRLLDGKRFDSSRLRGETFSFVVESREVILGWDLALPLMRKGEIAEFYIPSYLAYGTRGQGPIPPSTILVFEIELIEF
ncbi:MAG: FKBP-type peptidyl-prolyl cis-trans isomerase [Bernardetiaceae bacterium]